MDRRLSAGIALFAALTLSACVDGSWGDRVRASVSETRPMAKDGKFSLDNTNGRIEVTGWDEARVSIEATKRAGSDRALREMEIEIDEDDGDVRVRTRHRRSRLFGGQGRVDYLVKVPRTARVSVSRDSRSVTVIPRRYSPGSNPESRIPCPARSGVPAAGSYCAKKACHVGSKAPGLRRYS